jgi:hypothetical protein
MSLDSSCGGPDRFAEIGQNASFVTDRQEPSLSDASGRARTPESPIFDVVGS